MEKKNVILLTVVAVATLLVTVVGATFAYFNATVTNNGETMSVKSATTEGLTITYDDGAAVTASNVIPGWGTTYHSNDTKTITVTNDTAYNIEYIIKWTGVTNNFVAADQVNLTFGVTTAVAWIEATSHSGQPTTKGVTVADTKCPTAAGTQVIKQTLKAGEKATHTLQMKYANVNSAQGSQGQKFTGTLSLANADVKIVS